MGAQALHLMVRQGRVFRIGAAHAVIDACRAIRGAGTRTLLGRPLTLRDHIFTHKSLICLWDGPATQDVACAVLRDAVRPPSGRKAPADPAEMRGPNACPAPQTSG